MAPYLPEDFYRQILEALPIVCVDLLLKREGKYLLVRRTREPLKGEWWTPGGRILKDESALEAVRRKAWDEVGMVMPRPRFVGFYEDGSATSHFGVACHCVSLMFEGTGVGSVVLDYEADDFKWSEELPKRLLARWVRLESSLSI